MKKFILKIFVCSCVFAASVSSIMAQGKKAVPYFEQSEMPDMVKMPFCPPAEGSPAFIYDIKRYYWGKEQRKDSIIAAIAVRDAVYSLKTIENEFSIPFGLQISEKNTPEIYRLLRDALYTCDMICWAPKRYWHRVRPFMYFDEPTLTPHDEAALSKNGSYPSGHTIFGYSAALLLTEINPERADTIMSRGMMYGESRVIVGAHWQSDVEAGMKAASIAYAKLHTSPRFIEQMERAKREFAEKTQKP